MISNELTITVTKAADLLIERQLTIAFAESATAGKMSAEFSLACNAGKFLRGGLTCYDASLKSSILKVPAETLEKYTPESIEVTEAIARGLTTLIPADIHIGITGLPCAGGSETEEKPVGTMFIYGLFRGKEWLRERMVFQGSHRHILDQTINHLAQLLIKLLGTVK